MPLALGYMAGWVVGKLLGDVVITRPENEGLMSGLLCVDSEPNASTRFTEWAQANAATLGLEYTHKMARRLNRKSEYQSN